MTKPSFLKTQTLGLSNFERILVCYIYYASSSSEYSSSDSIILSYSLNLSPKLSNSKTLFVNCELNLQSVRRSSSKC